MKLAISRKNIWERAPRLLRVTVGGVLGLLPPPAVLGRRFRHSRRFIQASQWWDEDRIHAYQTERLRELATVAYRAQYWRSIFDQAGVDPATITPERLSALPFLTRHDVRSRLSEMWTRPPTSASVDYVATSGSTGEPIGFYIGADRSAVEYAYTVTSWGRAGYQLGTPLGVFRGKPVEVDAQGLRHTYDPLFRTHAYSVYHMSEANMSRYLAHVGSLGPCFLHGYPSSIHALARHLVRTGAPRPQNVKGVLLESETLYPGQRALIESVFGCRCFSSYGQTEKVVSATECEFGTDYHVWPTYGICELVDASGAPITTPGQRGEIVGTSFLNFVVPFIRYRTGDYATLAGTSCPHCGRRQLVLKDLRGHRVQELLVAIDGSVVPWTALNMHDDTFDNVLRFQFYQDTRGLALLRIVPGADFNGADQRRIAASLRKKLADRIAVRIELVESLPAAPNGKAVYVDQRLEGLEQFVQLENESTEPIAAGQ